MPQATVPSTSSPSHTNTLTTALSSPSRTTTAPTDTPIPTPFCHSSSPPHGGQDSSSSAPSRDGQVLFLPPSLPMEQAPAPPCHTTSELSYQPPRRPPCHAARIVEETTDSSSNTAVDSHVESSNTTDENWPMPSRGRTCISRVNVLPLEAHLHDNLTFTSDIDRSRYDFLRHKVIIPCKCLSIPILAALHIETTVTDYFQNIGWVRNFDVTHSTYYELVLEFYSTFQFDRHGHISLDTPDVVKFRLLVEHVIKAKRPLILRSLITQLLFSLHGSKAPISDLHVACQANPLDARCLDSMGLLLGTPSSFRFVPPGVRSTPSERVFR
ncbi:hypothetical protein J1N35_025587 [Gossypium stocksii]|uniref:Uncharacterized protein n=1 Tax=Gossypium stocksii TaxID=47602 RepID=A0A9D3V6T5_9ROSI|nr:hypothetical protein J1N35_025587 [Gossypium stocksii]